MNFTDPYYMDSKLRYYILVNIISSKLKCFQISLKLSLICLGRGSAEAFRSNIIPVLLDSYVLHSKVFYLPNIVL